MVYANDQYAGLEADIAFIVANFASEPSSLRVLSRYYAMVDTLFGMLVPDSLPETLPEIQKARQFIDENCCRKLTIDEIAAQCGLSRSVRSTSRVASWSRSAKATRGA